MKFIIEHSETRRVISGPFNIYASVADFEWLIKQLDENRKLNKMSDYGWIRIIEKPEAQKSTSDTKLKGWNE